MHAFRRYTNLTDLIYILRKKEIMLRDPQHWDDRNDAYYLQKYKEAKGLKTLLALCFAEDSGETYHHWRVFASGPNGVIIEFEKDCILTAFCKQCKKNGVDPVARSVRYTVIQEHERNPLCVEDLPFLKWVPYRDEREYRIVYANPSSRNRWGFKIDPKSIKRVSLSPWLPDILEDSVVEQLKSIQGFQDLCVSRSRVIEFERWKKVADRIVDSARKSRGARTG